MSFPVSLMIKPVGDLCQSLCQYCYYREVLPGQKVRVISDKLLEKAIREYMDFDQNHYSFSWQGGEPTLAGIDFYRKATDLQQKYLKPGKQVSNAFQTSGLNLNEAWAELFADTQTLVGISLDGPADLHDLQRLDKLGRPTHERVVNSIRMLQENKVDFNLLCVISQASLGRARDILCHFRELDCFFFQFIPCGTGPGEKVSPSKTLSGDQYSAFMLELLDAWIDLDDPRLFLRTHQNLLRSYLGLPVEFCQFRGECGGMVTLEQDGRLYPCDFFVEERFLLGHLASRNLQSLVGNARHKKFLSQTRAVHEDCKNCEYAYLCHGGCLRQREGRKAKGKNSLCESMKSLISESMNRFRQIESGERPAEQIRKIMNLNRPNDQTRPL